MNRMEELRQKMAKEEIDVLVISSEVNQSYICGLDYTDGYVLVFRETAYVLADFRYIEIAEKTVDAKIFRVVRPEGKMLTEVADLLAKHGAKRVAFEEDELNVASYLRLRRNLDKSVETVPSGSGMLNALRQVKDEDEMTVTARAQDITDRAFAHILTVIKPDMTERELALELEYTMRRMGADAMAKYIFDGFIKLIS